MARGLRQDFLVMTSQNFIFGSFSCWLVFIELELTLHRLLDTWLRWVAEQRHGQGAEST